MRRDGEEREPTDAELAAIEAEWPVVEAELELLDAQIVALTTRQGSANPLGWRRLRRAEHRVLAARRSLTTDESVYGSEEAA